MADEPERAVRRERMRMVRRGSVCGVVKVRVEIAAREPARRKRHDDHHEREPAERGTETACESRTAQRVCDGREQRDLRERECLREHRIHVR